MKRFVQVLLCALLTSAWIGVSGSCAFGADVTITLGRAAIEGTGDNQAVYFPELTVSSFAAGTYHGILIAFTGQLVDSDEIRISAVDGISENTGCSTKVSKIVKFDADKNSTQIQNFLRNGVRLRSLKNPKGQKIRLLLLTAEVNLPTIYCDKTQHYYQYVRYSGHKSWLDSYNEAKNSTFMGRRGYLATIASIEEDQFVHKACDGKVGWLGGTIFAQPNKITVPGVSGDPGTSFYDFANDASSKYYNDDWGDPRYRNAGQFPAGLHKAGWYWACGPECGQIFFDTMMVDSQSSKSYNGLTFDKSEKAFVRNEQAGRYFNWRATGYSDGAEPNYGTMSSPYAEPCLTTLSIRDGRRDQSFSWNNIMCNRHDGNGTYQPSGYFIEFGNQPVGNDPEYPAGTVVIDGDVPGLYQLTYKPGAGGGAARTFDMVTGLETNLTALSELGFTAPADRPYFFGWSTDASATAPMYTDAQATLDLSTPSKPLTLHAVWSKLPVVTGEFVDKQYFDLVKLAVRGFSSDDRQYVNCAAYACNAGARASTYAAQVPAGRFDFSVTSDRYVAQGGGDQKRFGDCSLCHAVTNLEIAASCRGPNLSGAFKWGTITEPSPLLPLGQLSLAVPIADYGRGQMIVGGLGGMDFQDTALADSFASIMNTLGTFDRNACYAPRAVVNLDIPEDERLESIRSAIADGGGDPSMLRHQFKLTASYACKSGSSFIEGSPKEYWLDEPRLIDVYYAYDCRTNDAASAGWSLWRAAVRPGVSSLQVEEIPFGAGDDEYFELGQGYIHLRVRILGTFGVVDPTRGEIDFGFAAKNTSCGHDSTWYFPAAKGVGNLVYDRVTFSLIDCGDGAEVNSPAESSSGVSSRTVTEKSLKEVAEMLKLASGAGSFGFRTPANLDGSYLKFTAERDDGFHPYEATVTFTTVTYTVILYPGYAGPGGVVQTNVFKNSRVLVLPRAEELGYRNEGKYFHYWSKMPENTPVLDDGQSFWDLGDGFTTNNLLAVWSDEPLYRGACPVGANALVDFCNLAGDAYSGLVLGCNVAPYHYVVKAPLDAIYNVRYTSADGVRRLGIVTNTAARVEDGYDLGDELLVSDFIENGSQAKLLAGGLEFYDAAVTARVEEIRASMYASGMTMAMVPELSIRAAEVDEAARIAFTNSPAIPAGTELDGWVRLTAKRHIEFRNPDVGSSIPDDKEVEDLAELDPAAPALDVILAFDTGLDGLAVSNTWAVYRSAAGAVDKLTTTPNAAGEYLAVGDGHLQLHLRKLGTLAVHKPVTETTFVLSDPEEVEDGDYAIWKLSNATGSGDRLFSSARLFIPESTFREGWAFAYFDLAVTNHNAEIMFESNSTVVVVSFSTPKTAAEIAELVKAYAYAYTEDELFGSWARLALCTDASGEEQAYVSDPVILPSITALVRFAPGDGATGEVRGSVLFYPDWPGRLSRFVEFTNDWTVASGRYFFGWRRETGGDVVFGDAQKIVNGFVIGQTNILTAVWTNMPVVAGDVALDADAATVTVQSFTNALEATIFKGGADMNRYALPLPGGRPYNVAVEYRDAVGGAVKSVETVLVTNDVALGANYDSTGRVATATSVVRPTSDLDFVLVGGLESVTGSFAAVVAEAGHLTSGAGYVALTNAVGTKEGTYFNLALETDGAAVGTAPAPLTLLLPFDSTGILDSTNLFKVYRYQGGAVTEVPTNEYVVCDGYLCLVTTNVAPIAIAKSLSVVFADCGKDTLRWKRTDTRSSYFAAIRLKLVRGDANSLRDACFLFEDRIAHNADGTSITNACLWGGRLDRQNAGNHIASQVVHVNGTAFRKVPLVFFKEAVGNAGADGLVSYGVTDESLANSKSALLPQSGSVSTAALTNSWAHQTEIEVMSRPGEIMGDTPETLSGVMGFLGYSTGGQRMTYLALASGDQGGVTNYEAVVTEITEAALASADPERMIELVSNGPISLNKDNLIRIRQSLAVTAIVDENSAPYCRIADIAFDESEITGRVEVGAGEEQGAVGRNASVTLLGAASVDGPYTERQTIPSVGVDGAFRFDRSTDCSFFKLRINVQDL